jgi:hypothetical protein
MCVSEGLALILGQMGGWTNLSYRQRISGRHSTMGCEHIVIVSPSV